MDTEDDAFLAMQLDLLSTSNEIEEEERLLDRTHELTIRYRQSGDLIYGIPLFLTKSTATAETLSRLTQMNRAISKEPENSAFYVDRGYLFLSLGDHNSSAIQDLKKASTQTLDSTLLFKCILGTQIGINPKLNLPGMVIVYFRDGNYTQAMHTLGNIEKLCPSKTPFAEPYLYCLYLRGTLHERNMSFLKAVSDFTTLLRHGKLMLAQRERAFCLAAINDFVGALFDIKQVTHTLTSLLLLDSSVSNLNEAAKCLVWQSQIYDQSGDAQNALKSINKALQYGNPVHPGEYTLVRLSLRSLLTMAGWFLQRGMYQQTLGGYEEAIADFSHVILTSQKKQTEQPSHDIPLATAVALRGECYFLTQNYALAIQDGVTCVTQDPNQQKVYEWLLPSFIAIGRMSDVQAAHVIDDLHGCGTLILSLLKTPFIRRSVKQLLKYQLAVIQEKQAQIIHELTADEQLKKPKKHKKEPQTPKKPVNHQKTQDYEQMLDSLYRSVQSAEHLWADKRSSAPKTPDAAPLSHLEKTREIHVPPCPPPLDTEHCAIRWSSQPLPGTTWHHGETWGCIPCAIKLVPKSSWPNYRHDLPALLGLLLAHDLPMAFLRFYNLVETESTIVMAFEPATVSLVEHMREPTKTPNVDVPLHGLSQGLAFLHNKDLAHGDITPSHVMVFEGSDLAKQKLPDLLSHFKFADFGSVGPPPGPTTPRSKPEDVAALGTVFYYVFSSGKHPEGADMSSFPPLLHHLLTTMCHEDPNARPKIETVVSHPYFWNRVTCLQYIYRVSNLIDYEPAPVKQAFFASLDVEKGNWRHKIKDTLWSHLTLHRPYVETNPLHLIRAIRNLYEHWMDIRQKDKPLFTFFGSLEGVWTYFSQQFPTLLLSVWCGMRAIGLHTKLQD